MVTHRLVDLLYPRSMLLGQGIGLIAPADGVPVGPYPLIGPVHQDDVGGHMSTLPPSSRFPKRVAYAHLDSIPMVLFTEDFLLGGTNQIYTWRG